MKNYLGFDFENVGLSFDGPLFVSLIGPLVSHITLPILHPPATPNNDKHEPGVWHGAFVEWERGGCAAADAMARRWIALEKRHGAPELHCYALLKPCDAENLVAGPARPTPPSLCSHDTADHHHGNHAVAGKNFALSPSTASFVHLPFHSNSLSFASSKATRHSGGKSSNMYAGIPPKLFSRLSTSAGRPPETGVPGIGIVESGAVWRCKSWMRKLRAYTGSSFGRCDEVSDSCWVSVWPFASWEGAESSTASQRACVGCMIADH